MGLQLLKNLVHTMKLLGRQKGVVENPVIAFAMLVLTAQKFNRRFHQLQHPVAPLYALGMMLQIATGQICTCKVDRIQKVLNAGAKLNLEASPHLLNGQLQAPHHIPIFFEQLQGIVKQRILRRLLYILLIFYIGLVFHSENPPCDFE